MGTLPRTPNLWPRQSRFFGDGPTCWASPSKPASNPMGAPAPLFCSERVSPFDLPTPQPAIVQRRRYERPADTGARQNFYVPDVAHAAGGIEFEIGRCGAKRREAFKVRTGAAAHPRQRHRDRALRPKAGIDEKLRRTLERLAAKVEGQHDTGVIPQRAENLKIALRLAADHESSPPRGEPSARRFDIAHAVVDPKRKSGKRRLQKRDRTRVFPDRFDRVEIGDIKAFKGI